MDTIVTTSGFILAAGILLLVLLKAVLFIRYKRYNLEILGFFWFSHYSVINSGSENGRIAKRKLNKLSLYIAILLFSEFLFLVIAAAIG